MKKLIQKIKELWVWFTSDEVRYAINHGATYAEVEEIVKKEVNGNG